MFLNIWNFLIVIRISGERNNLQMSVRCCRLWRHGVEIMVGDNNNSLFSYDWRMEGTAVNGHTEMGRMMTMTILYEREREW